MFGYFWVTMSPTCSQAFFSTSEPDHMNQVSVTGPPDEPDEPPELPELPPQAASRTAANATVRILVNRDSRIPLLTQDVVVHADRIAGLERKVRHISRRPRRSDLYPGHRPCQGRLNDVYPIEMPLPAWRTRASRSMQPTGSYRDEQSGD